jgi:hypothetical protein
MTRQSISDLVRFASELARFLGDIALFAGAIVVCWGGMTWVGIGIDRVLGTAPSGNVLRGQAGPFAMIGLVSGCFCSLYAINWIMSRAHRKR